MICRRAAPDDMPAVYRLTHDAYVGAGYIEPRPDGELRHYPHLDGIRHTAVLVVEDAGEIIGSNSWTLDGPQRLHADVDFPSECDAVRAEGRVLGASWRIVVERGHRSGGKAVHMLMQSTVCDMLAAGIETALFTFDARHERFYRRVLHMTTVARREHAHGLGVAQPVLMRLDAEQVPAQWVATAVTEAA